MNGRRIAIACQGGGSQCAFVAGALKTLLESQARDGFRIVGLSGTSGGALTAALAWVGLLEQARGDGRGKPVEDRILDFWKDLSAQTPREVMFDQICVEFMRLTERGLLPSFASSPSGPVFRFWSQAVGRMLGRPEFTDLRALLFKHLDFDELPALIQADSPVLLVGACDVIEGNFKVFSSVNREISPEALLASAAIPNLFPAVHVDGHAYWDGIFSSNPPVAGFLRRPLMGNRQPPEEIWIIQVNRARHDSVPETPSEIFDRRNHLAGNLSLRHELEFIEMVNVLLYEQALTNEFRDRFGLGTTELITVRFLRMSDEIQRGLDYPSKLSRQPRHIARLIADGQAQANLFLSGLRDETPRAELTGDLPAAATH